MTFRHSQALMPDLLLMLLIPSAFMKSATDTSSGINLQFDVIKAVARNDTFPKNTHVWMAYV